MTPSRVGLDQLDLALTPVLGTHIELTSRIFLVFGDFVSTQAFDLATKAGRSRGLSGTSVRLSLRSLRLLTILNPRFIPIQMVELDLMSLQFRRTEGIKSLTGREVRARISSTHSASLAHELTWLPFSWPL